MNDELLLKFLTKNCTPEELEQVLLWIKSDKKNADFVFEAEQLWSLKDEMRFAQSKYLKEALHRYNKSIDTYTLQVTPITESRSRKISITWKSALKVAAVIIIAVMATFNLLQLKEYVADPTMNIVEVPAGQSITLTLSDGTKVWLNAESRLAYPSKFSSRKRTVTLEGEGYFEVVRNDRSPFSVAINALTVKVLGTKFNARSYPDEEQSVVTLTEGKVEVSLSGTASTMLLYPNEQAIYTTGGGFSKNRLNESDQFTLWKEGELVFNELPLAEIAKTLERRFNVQFVIEDHTLASELFTCRTDPSASLFDVLNLLKQTRRLNYEINNAEIILTNKTPKPMK